MASLVSAGIAGIRSATVIGGCQSRRLLTYSKCYYSQGNAGSSSRNGSAHSTSIFSGQWDTNNRIRVIGSAAAIAVGTFTFLGFIYSRASTKELWAVEAKLEAKIESKIDKVEAKLEAKIDGLTHAQQRDRVALEAKIDGLTHAMLHTQQRDRIALEAENRELKREIEEYKT